MGRRPDDLARLGVEGEESTARGVRWRGLSERRRRPDGSSGCFRNHIRERHIHTTAVVGRAPLHTAERRAFADACLPENLAAAIRIDRVYDAGLLTGNQRTPAVRQIDQHRRRSEIVVGALRFGAVHAERFGQTARDVERVARCHLLRPEQLARIDLERHERV